MSGFYDFNKAWNECSKTSKNMDEDEKIATMIMAGALLGGAFILGYKLGKTVHTKEIEVFLDSCIKQTKKGTGVLLEISTKKNKNVPIYIWKN